MACFLLPPNATPQVYLFSIVILLLGCLVGWAWGNIAMVAAFAARDKLSLESAVQQARASIANEPDQIVSFQTMVFRGEFLDTRSTAIFGAFLGVGTFLFTILRVRAPNAVFAGVFGNVFLDVICTFGPLLPTPQYLTMKTFLVSTCVYVAVSLVSIILIFPETLNHEWLNSYTEVVDMVKILVDMQDMVLSQTTNQLDSAHAILAKINGIQDGALAMFQGFTMNSSMLNLEFSCGRWNGADVQTLEMPLKTVITRARMYTTLYLLGIIAYATVRGMSAFATQYCEYMSSLAERMPSVSTNSSDAVHDEDDIRKFSKNQRLNLQVQDTQRVLQVRGRLVVLEQTYETQVEKIDPLIRDSTSQLRTALSKTLESVSKAIQDVNSRRYKSIEQEPLAHLRAARDFLSSTLAMYEEFGRLDVFDPLTNVLDTASGQVFDQHGNPLIPLRPLFMSSVFESNLCWTVDCVVELMDRLVKLMEERAHNRLWAPTQLRKLADVLFHSEESTLIRDAHPKLKPGRDDEYLRVYNARSPRGFGQSLSHTVRIAWCYLNTDEAIFAFKCTVVTLALWLPQVIKSSAELTYNERGLWAMIIAQSGVEMYMSDHIGGFVIRTAGTIVGGLIGTTIWYISSGSGPGNPCGLAAAFGICIIPLVFFRLFWYEQIASVSILIVTIILVIGFSWVNTHLSSTNVIYGYEIFWRRTLLVLVGFGASFIVMMFPPQPARRAVRLDNAAPISEIPQIYGILISSWLRVEEDSTESVHQTSTQK
ncbi:fusaric acid resistance-like protein [Rhizoctonia solani AG-3 Rhs1AP]|nr:fusaric acid resistance-like protein [Rhizoctonia solani AG-3 Rhs1AP]